MAYLVEAERRATVSVRQQRAQVGNRPDDGRIAGPSRRRRLQHVRHTARVTVSCYCKKVRVFSAQSVSGPDAASTNAVLQRRLSVGQFPHSQSIKLI